MAIFIFLLSILGLLLLLVFLVEPLSNYPYPLPTVPRIIHQTAPRDKSRWHAVWKECQKTWMTHFVQDRQWSYRMWTDEDIDVFMKEEFPWFYERFQAYPKNIQRIDMVRYFILYRYGGIYADMDMRCNKYFMDVVDHSRVSIVESGYKQWETVQNSLMISPPGDPFWMKVIAEAMLRAQNSNPDVMYTTGPILLSDVYAKQEKNVDLLPYVTFNPPRNAAVKIDDAALYTRHLNTVSWM